MEQTKLMNHTEWLLNANINEDLIHNEINFFSYSKEILSDALIKAFQMKI